MSSECEPLLEPRGIGVAKIIASTSNPRAIEIVHYGRAQNDGPEYRPRTEVLVSDTVIDFPGRFTFTGADLELDVSRSSEFGFAVSAWRAGKRLAQGLGLADRDSPGAIMVAWWTGDTEPYGVVKYSIRDARTIVGYYISRMTPDAPGEDIAVGDTSPGFRGDYVLNSREVNGRTWGPHDWTLTPRGEATDLTWRENGLIFCRGVGMRDPQDSASIIATYIAL